MRTLSILSIACPVVFILLELLTRTLSNKLDYFKIPLSQLVFGQYGWLGSLCFIVLAATLFVFTLAISRILPKGKLYKIIIGVFLVTAVCFFLAAFIRTEQNHATWSVHRVIHVIIVSLGAGLFPVGCFLFAQNIKHDQQWGGFSGFTLAVAFIALAADGSRLFVLVYWPLLGLQELLLLSAGLIWIEAVSFKTLKMSGD